ncbi:hypothetical protein B7Z28_01730 [Candidatus Saccharibacteria bacterium 32-45-3]|nr:MAG: hypothetical protein B7Z28_01730 [Candidatus Saccharibacteria bacterium 32-45-3]
MLVTGILAVVFIIEGGRRFITGSGNPEKVKQARDIIIYACVGLLVSILAFTIVNFVVLATN